MTMNTGNITNDEATAIGNFIEQLNNLQMIGIIQKRNGETFIQYDFHPDFKCRNSNDELPYKELPLHHDSLKNLYWNYTDGTSFVFTIEDGKAKIGKAKHELCQMCYDSLVLKVGEYDYTTCPCVGDNEKDIERQAQNIVSEICTLFHLQETTDWEQKAINLIKPLIK